MARARREKAAGVLEHGNTEPLRDLRNHLEFLGYTTERHEDGWVSVTSPVRPDFFAKPLPFGVRLVAKFHLGHMDESLITRWLAHVNDQNRESLLVRLALEVDAGDVSLRATALLPATYDRTTVGVLLDLWQREVGGEGEAPPLGSSGDGTRH